MERDFGYFEKKYSLGNENIDICLQTAIDCFEEICDYYKQFDCIKLKDYEVKLYGNCLYKLYELQSEKYSLNDVLNVFSLYLENDFENLIIQDCYLWVLVLELKYQEAYVYAKRLLSYNYFENLALRVLIDFGFVLDGVMKIDEHIYYARRLYEMADDLKEKEQLKLLIDYECRMYKNKIKQYVFII